MNNSLDLIAHQIAECIGKIEEYQRVISQLRQKIRELSWQAIEADGEISHYDDAV